MLQSKSTTDEIVSRLKVAGITMTVERNPTGAVLHVEFGEHDGTVVSRSVTVNGSTLAAGYGNFPVFQGTIIQVVIQASDEELFLGRVTGDEELYVDFQKR